MKLTHAQYDLAVAYVKGELSGKVLRNFETTLPDSEALREEVAFQRTILSAVRLNVAADTLRQATHKNLLEDKTQHPQFEVIQNNIQKARTYNINRQRQIRRWWVSGLVAAACMVLVGTVGINMYLNNQLEGDIVKIINTIDIEDRSLKIDGIKSVSARTDVIIYKLKEAENAFETQDWDTALSIFEQLRSQFKYESAAMDFCESIVFFYKKQYTKSIEKLEDIDLNQVESDGEIRHFLTLSYLKNKNKSKAREQYDILLSDTTEAHDKQTIRGLKKYFIL